jgi:MFS family permease
MVDERIRTNTGRRFGVVVRGPDPSDQDNSKQTSCAVVDNDQHDTTANDDGDNDGQQVAGRQLYVSDLLGDYGNYQLFLTIITFVRYVCLAMMTNTGPLIAPELTFWCRLPQQTTSARVANDVPLSVSSIFGYNQTTDASYNHQQTTTTDELLLKNKCTLELTNGTTYKCSHWTYDQSKTGVTITDAYNLVCDRDWLRSAFQSSISIGVALASVVFGALSDKHGRRKTMIFGLVISLLAGLVSCWAPNYLTYTLARSLCTMCDLCIAASLYTIIVETLGNKYRGIVCLIVTTGWSMGVMVMPWVTGYFRDFRKVMMFTVACHVITMPWILLVCESPRWLLVNGQIEMVQRDIRRICSLWNRKSKQELAEIDAKFQLLKLRYLKSKPENEKQPDRHVCRVLQALFGGFSKIRELFDSRELLITTMVFVWITFNSELLYMMLIFVNSDHNDNVKLNYAIGGLMESLATLISILMITSLTRRLSLSLTLTTISISMFGLAFTYNQPEISIYTLNIAKLAGSTLTSLVFVIVIELFPTSLRQTGAGVSSTLGSCGAILAPFVHNELSKLIGFGNVMLVLSVLPLTAAVLVPFFLRETKGVELADEFDEIES